MALKFSDYKSAREAAEFDSKFNDLCEAIVLSGIKFETYWTEHFIPTLNESTYVANEDELLNEIWPFSSKKQAAPASPAPNFDFLNQPSGGQQMTNRMDQWQNDQRAAAQAAKEAARQKKLANFQQGVDQQIGTIKQRFMTAMRDFLKAATDDAKTQNDPHMYQIVNSFYKKIMSAAEPVANEFKLKAKFGKAAYQDEFARERGAMAQNQTQAMKSRLQGKFGAAPASTPASTPVTPTSVGGASMASNSGDDQGAATGEEEASYGPARPGPLYFSRFKKRNEQ
jgi:hypothetical protein